MSHISRSPNLLPFVPKEIEEPSLETVPAMALSRSLRGTPPNTETIQMLPLSDVPRDVQSFASWGLAEYALAINRVLSGNQDLELMTQSKLFLVTSPG